MEASEAGASGPAATRGPWRGKQGVDFNDVIDIFAKSKARFLNCRSMFGFA